MGSMSDGIARRPCGVRWIGTRTCFTYTRRNYVGEAEPSVHAAAILERGKWISGAIDPASRGRSQMDGRQLLQMYTELGLKLQYG